MWEVLTSQARLKSISPEQDSLLTSKGIKIDITIVSHVIASLPKAEERGKEQQLEQKELIEGENSFFDACCESIENMAAVAQK